MTRRRILHLVTAWKATTQEEQAMPKTSRTMPTADEIAEMASAGRGCFRVLHQQVYCGQAASPCQCGLTHGMLRELDERAARLNVSRQA